MKQLVLLFSIAVTSCLVAGAGYKNVTQYSHRVSDFAFIQCHPSMLTMEVQTSRLTIGMTGDILLHHPLYTYSSYEESFRLVSEEMKNIDFLLANQESMPGGTELGLSGYPLFNSPKHIIRDLQLAGVDMLSIANNHTMDRSETGLLNTIKHMKEYGMPYVGAYESLEDREMKRIVEIAGVRIGILAYTYGLNGLPVPKGKEYIVSLLDKVGMEKDIQGIKDEVDVVIVSVHWGEEYSLQPSATQEELAHWFAEQGVDIVFGHHPHVLQPFTQIENTKIFYSLGNFYSAQQFDSTFVGGIGKVQVARHEIAGKRFVEIGEASFYPTAVLKQEAKGPFIVAPLQHASSQYDEQWVERIVGLTLYQ
ncbi:CapA family protein [Sporosarcina sp. OR05]|uniref:CapA family protein n=1 Tax=Sporosarcina sp. OR05 TaxID=2969819 RepID=UPI00352AC0F0